MGTSKRLEDLFGKSWLEDLSTNLVALSFFLRWTDKLKFHIMAIFKEINKTVGPNLTSISQHILYVIQICSFKLDIFATLYKCGQSTLPSLKCMFGWLLWSVFSSVKGNISLKDIYNLPNIKIWLNAVTRALSHCFYINHLFQFACAIQIFGR